MLETVSPWLANKHIDTHTLAYLHPQAAKEQQLQELQAKHQALHSKLLEGKQQLARRDTQILALQQYLAQSQMALLDHMGADGPMMKQDQEGEAGPGNLSSSRSLAAPLGLLEPSSPAACGGRRDGEADRTAASPPASPSSKLLRAGSNANVWLPSSGTTSGTASVSGGTSGPSSVAAASEVLVAEASVLSLAEAVTAGPLSFTAAMDSRRLEKECRRLQGLVRSQAQQVRLVLEFLGLLNRIVQIHQETACIAALNRQAGFDYLIQIGGQNGDSPTRTAGKCTWMGFARV
jgi:hypothetical protein